MSQQINLLPPRARSIAVPAGIACLVVVFVVAGAYVRSSMNELGRTRDSLAAAKDRGAQVRAALGGLQPSGRADTRAEIEADIARLRSRADAAGEFLTQVDSGVLGKAGGYPTFFRAISAAADDNVWLTRVVIARGGAVQISGSATSNDAVLQYTRRVGQEFRASGVSFRTLEIRSAPAGAATAGAVTFTLS